MVKWWGFVVCFLNMRLLTFKFRSSKAKYLMQQAFLEDIKTLMHDLDHCWLGFNYEKVNKMPDKLTNYEKKILHMY